MLNYGVRKPGIGLDLAIDQGVSIWLLEDFLVFWRGNEGVLRPIRGSLLT